MKKTFLLPLLFSLFSLSVWGQIGGLSVGKTTCNLRSGFVQSETKPRFGWQLHSDGKEIKQTAYEMEIKDAVNGWSVWKSGVVFSSQSQMVELPADVRLTSTCNYYTWRVRVWDNDHNMASDWSAESSFLIVPSQITKATWIGAITRKDSKFPEGRMYQGAVLKESKAQWDAVDSLATRSICLRKEFKATRPIRMAMLYISGLGHYELSLNGAKVEQSEFAPLWSDYDKTVYYNVYDVTQRIRKGKNAIGVLLGNGFYNVVGQGRYRKLQIGFGAPTLWTRLEIVYEDGAKQIVESDDSWKYTLSPITYNCIYGGESYDARLEQYGWNRPDFKEDDTWKPVVVQESPKGSLRLQTADPVMIMEYYDVQKTAKIPAEKIDTVSKETKRTVDPSVIVFDMGQNLAGFPEITVQGKRGQKITLLVAEALTENGACNQRQTGRQYYYEYTLKGGGIETWHPRFSYYGFRYIQVEGAVMGNYNNPRGLPVLKKIQSCFVYNSAKKGSTFECSNVIFNKAHRLIEKAVRSNMQSVFTDCPHREKLGWLEQDHLNGPGLLYNYDLTTYVPKLMQDIADAQQPDGMVPTIAPLYTIFAGKGMDDFGNSPEWGSTLILLPFMYYDYYGDDLLIKQYYPQMRKYVEYLSSRAENHILSFGLGDWYDYGDFRAGFSRNTPIPLVATAHYIFDLQCMVRAAKMIDNQYDEQHYSDLLKKVIIAFNQTFYHPETAQYGSGSQCSNALPLFLGLTGTNRKDVLQNLVKDVRSHGSRLTTGDVGNRYLFQTLARNGENELMYEMFNHEDAPGYGFQLKFGATTLTEQWDPRQGSSWNHFMMGQIDEWFFRSLAGIQNQPGKVGMQHLLIAPQVVGDMTNLSASVETLYGKVSVMWKRKLDGGKGSLTVEIPANCDAIITLPFGQGLMEVGSGIYTYSF